MKRRIPLVSMAALTIAMLAATARVRMITIAVLTPSERFDALLQDEERMNAIRRAASLLGEQLKIED